MTSPFTEQEIRSALRRPQLSKLRSDWTTERDPADRQEAAREFMRGLAYDLTYHADTDGWPDYVADKLWEDWDYDRLLTDVAFNAAAAGGHGYELELEEALIAHVRDCDVRDERAYIEELREAAADEDADRAYDRARVEGRWPRG